MRYLIYTNANGKNVGAWVTVPPDFTAAQFDALQEAFEKALGGDFAQMIRLGQRDQTRGGIYFDYCLAGPHGALFAAYKLPTNSWAEFNQGVREIRRTRDVVHLTRVTIHRMIEWDLDLNTPKAA